MIALKILEIFIEVFENSPGELTGNSSVYQST